MTFEEWKQLSSDEQQERCQALNPYSEWPLFKSVEEAFKTTYTDVTEIKDVFCGFASGLGPINAITVSLESKGRKIKLPSHFLGFPVLRGRRKK